MTDDRRQQDTLERQKYAEEMTKYTMDLTHNLLEALNNFNRKSHKLGLDGLETLEVCENACVGIITAVFQKEKDITRLFDKIKNLRQFTAIANIESFKGIIQ